MSKPKRYTVTSALPYANGPLHLGHIAGAYLPADIFVRYLRLKGEDVVYICGSDENGAAITLRAKKEGVKPQEIVDKYHETNKKAFADFGINFDIYHRTSAELHHETAAAYFKKLNDDGKFEQQTSEQYFDEEHQQFLADRYITGECPKCQNPNAYGDQCEKCGSALSPTELINPKSTLSGNAPVLKKTSHWYLPMNEHEEWLKDWIKEGKLEGEQHHEPTKWKNHVTGQCMSWIDSGLQPRAMTRDLDWGVKVPVEGADGKVLYVWLDAPIGYISATKQWAADHGKEWEPYWKDKETKLVHFIGKDNIVFHCIIFPILLKLHGEFILPDNVPANEFLNLEGDKFSTSRNWAVWLHEYLEDLPDRKDELRYVMCSIMPENKDAEFTWKDFQARVNNELVAVLGNFVNRAVVLTHKYFDGKVPALGKPSEMDQSVLDEMKSFPEKVAQKIEGYKFKEALFEAMNLARLGNKYLADTEPWKLIKEDEDQVKTILNIALQISANLSVVFKPFLPEKTAKLEQILNVDPQEWTKAGGPLLSDGHQLNKAELLFQKFEDETVDQQIEKLKAATAVTSKFPPMKDEVAFDDFMKMDIRTATILEAERVPKTDKLLQLKVDTGLDQRTVVSGIAEFYSPENIIGQQVCILMNLAPRKIRGIQSQGMILMAENSEGELAFVSPTKEMEAGGGVQ